MKPTVNICIPVYNNVDMIEAALLSAVNQTYENVEIWVIDNASTDGTGSLVERFISVHRKVRYLRHSQNLGMPANFNACLHQGAGELTLILCSDDILEPRCVEFLVEELLRHPEAVLTACGRCYVDSILRPIRLVRAFRRTHVLHGNAAASFIIARGNTIGEPSAVLFRRHAAARGFDPNYSQLLDFEMWLHLCKMGSVVYSHLVLCKIRQHAKQLTKENIRSGRLISEKERLFAEVIQPMSSQLSIYSKILWDIRMLSSLYRVKSGGAVVQTREIKAVFYRPFYLLGLALLNLQVFVRNLVTR